MLEIIQMLYFIACGVIIAIEGKYFAKELIFTVIGMSCAIVLTNIVMIA